MSFYKLKICFDIGSFPPSINLVCKYEVNKDTCTSMKYIKKHGAMP